MHYRLRPYRTDDAEQIAALTLAAICRTGPRAYSHAQVDAWASRYSMQQLLDGAARGYGIYVAVDCDDRPAAYAVMEVDGHIDMLYTHPNHAGRGLARQLLSACEEAARAERVPRLHTEASELARPVFERLGWTLLHRRDFAISRYGRDVLIHNYAMEKLLSRGLR